MPKSRDPGRSKPGRHDDPAKPPPDQAEVERAIRSVVERLKPKLPKSKPERKGGGAALGPTEWDSLLDHRIG